MTQCHCGRPLHYSDPEAQATVERLITERGEYVAITVGDRTWSVQRHYIALHGINASELPALGFTELTDTDIRNHEGYVGAFTRSQGDGAIANGTVIRKTNTVYGDTVLDGTKCSTASPGTSVLVGKKRWATDGERAFSGKQDGHGKWHGYPVGWLEVPTAIRNEWQDAGRVKRRSITQHWRHHGK